MSRHLPLVLLLLSAPGCDPGVPAAPPALADGGVPMSASDAGPPPECRGDHDCPGGFVCAAVEGVPTCVADPDPPPPGDGSDCAPCPAPGECRDGACLQPSSTGGLCEFDSACGDGELCLAGRCTPDPRIPIPCVADVDCPTGLACDGGGQCTCRTDSDCPGALFCVDGGCRADECLGDDECPGESLCEAGRCAEPLLCRIEAPDFSGRWRTRSRLTVREALPGWLDGLLRAVDGPFAFLAGDTTCIDFGLPGWVENAVCDLIRPFVRDTLPPWATDVFRGVRDLNRVLGEWWIEETLELEAGVDADSYRGEHRWDAVEIRYRGRPVVGTPETILDWRFSPAPFNAAAVCGTLYLDRHPVRLSIGSVIAWAVDAVIHEASERRFDGLADALVALTDGFCGVLGDAADEAVEYDGVGAAVRAVCGEALGILVDAALAELRDARIGADPITLRGHGPITGPDAVREGVWDGELLGRPFSGVFCAVRGDGEPCDLR